MQLRRCAQGMSFIELLLCHMPVTLLSRECLYGGIRHWILSLSLYYLLLMAYNAAIQVYCINVASYPCTLKNREGLADHVM